MKTSMKLGLAFVFGTLALIGCATVAQQGLVTAYGAEQQACVNDAGNWTQYRTCVAAVREKWCGKGGALYEAGACNYDGGSP